MSGVRLLWVSDSPALATAGGTAARHILSRLSAAHGFCVCCLGVGHAGARDSAAGPPCDVFDFDPAPTGGLEHAARRFQPDLVLTLGRPAEFAWVPHAADAIGRPWIAYCAVHSAPLSADGADVLRWPDMVLATTGFGDRVIRDAIAHVESRVVPLGVDTTVFRPLESRQDRRRDQSLAERFVVGFVGRNTPENQIPRLIQAFARFAVRRPEAILYLHTDPADPAGGDLAPLIRRLGIEDRCIFTAGRRAGQGLADADLNQIYNLFDVLVLPSGAVAFGLSMLEAMAAGVPVVVPDCEAARAAAPEHARLVRASTRGASEQSPAPQVADERDLVECLHELSASPAARSELARRARDEVAALTWERCAEDLCRAIEDLASDRPVAGESRLATRSRPCGGPLPPKRPIPSYKRRHSVAFVAPQLWLGGGEVHLREVVSHLHECGSFSLAVASLNAHSAQWEQIFSQTGISIADELPVDGIYELPRRLPLPAKRDRLARWLHDIDPDVLVYYAYDWPVQAFGRLPRRPPIVIEICHVMPPPDHRPSDAGAVDRFVCVSQPIARRLLTACPELAERVLTIPNGAREYRPTLASPRGLFGLSPEDFVVGFVGRFDGNKRAEDLIRAIHGTDDPRIKALLVGWGPLRGRCRELVGELGLQDRVVLSPPRRDMGNVYGALDCLCLLSHSEGAPLSVLEAALMGVPVIVTPVGNLPDVFAHGESALFVRVGDGQDLVRSILRLAHSPQLSARLATNGRAAVLSRQLVVKRMAAQYADLIRSLVGHETVPTTEVVLHRHVGLGDVLMATSGARALKQQSWDTKITFAAGDSYHPLLAASPYVDRSVADGHVPPGSSAATHVHLRHASAWYRQRHIVDVHVEQLGQEPSSPHRTVDLFLTRDDRRKALALLGESDGLDRPRVVGLHVFGTEPAKHWSADNWAEVVGHLRRHGFRVVQLGAPDEPLIEGVEPARPAGPDGLRVQAAIVEQCAFVICVDSGFQQVAQGVSTPAIVLYGGASGGTAPSAYAENLNLESALDCTCNLSQGRLALHDCEPCPRGFECMRHITVSQVLDAVNVMIERLAQKDGAEIEVSVVLVNRDGGPALGRAADAVLAQDGVGLELIVVDDGSTDRSVERLSGCADSRLRLVRQREKGWALAATSGLRLARGEFVMLLDASEVLTPGALRSMVATIRQHADRAAVIGPVIEPGPDSGQPAPGSRPGEAVPDRDVEPPSAARAHFETDGQALWLWRTAVHRRLGYIPNVPLPRYFLHLALVSEFGEPVRMAGAVATRANGSERGRPGWEVEPAVSLTRRAWHLWKTVSSEPTEPDVPQRGVCVHPGAGRSAQTHRSAVWAQLQEASDGHLTASGEHLTAVAMEIYGTSVVFETNRPCLSEHLRLRLGSFLLPRVPDAPDVAMQIVLVPSLDHLPGDLSPGDIGRGRFASERAESILVFAPTDSSVFLADMATRRLSAMLVEPHTDLFWLSNVVTELIPQLLMGDRLMRIHASAVARDGRAILLAGASGAGKSTAALSLAHAGFDLISDDKPILMPSQDAVSVLPYCQDVHLRTDAPALFPELRDVALAHEPGFDVTGLLAADVAPRARKICFPARDVYPHACLSPATAALVVFPEVGSQARWTLDPIAAEQVRVRLALERLRFDGENWPLVQECWEKTVDRLVRTTRHFVLRASRDLAGLADHLAGLVAGTRAGS